MEYNNIKIHAHERLDDLHRNGYMLIQNPKHFCFGADAVLLSGFAFTEEGDRVLDLGTGTGVIPILMCGKTNAGHFTALEIQEESVDMARRSVALNHLSDRIEIIHGDINHMTEIFKPSSFDCITVNPPYMNDGGGLKNNDSPRAVARHEILVSLAAILYGSARILRPGGRFYMIHRPHRLADIICGLRENKLEPKTIRFVHPYSDKEPNMVLIEAIRGAKPMVKVLAPLVIYNKDGSYTEEVHRIYYE